MILLVISLILGVAWLKRHSYSNQCFCPTAKTQSGYPVRTYAAVCRGAAQPDRIFSARCQDTRADAAGHAKFAAVIAA